MTAAPISPDAGSGLPRRIAFLGFGLIGGSIAKSLRAAGVRRELVAWTPTGRGPAEGLRAGVLNRAAGTAAEATDGAELVIIAGPAIAVLATIGDLAGPLGEQLAPGATITDVASTKALIASAAAAVGLPFVGGHPMAGTEEGGFAASRADLFAGRPWVIVPGTEARERDVARVEALVAAVGAHPIRMTAETHDQAVAAISHLPLVVAAALVEAVAASADPDRAARWAVARELAAGGWASMTRLARGDPSMGAGILATNPGPVAAALRDLRRVVDSWIEQLEADGAPRDSARIAERLEAARSALVDDAPS